jgi:hypothetical protein
MIPRLFISLLLLLSYFVGWAQDEVHLQTGKTIKGKVTEIDIDTVSVVAQTGKKAAENLKIPKYKIAYIAFENGKQQFMAPDIIRLTNEKVILAKVVHVKEDRIEYLNAQTESSDLESVSKEKIVNIQYGKAGNIEGFYDQIILASGKTILGEVLEVDVDTLSYKEGLNTKKVNQTALSEVEKVIFRNGHEQVFAQTDSVQQENKKPWWKIW